MYVSTAKWRDHIVIVGRVDKESDLTSVWLYNVSSGEAKKLPDMKWQWRRECSAVVVYEDILVVMGGWSWAKSTLRRAECYNFLTDKWTKLPRMKRPRRFPSAVVRCISSASTEKAAIH